MPAGGDRALACAYLAQSAAELQAAQGMLPAGCHAAAVAHAHAATELAVKAAIVFHSGFDGGLFSHYAARLLQTRLPKVWRRTPPASNRGAPATCSPRAAATLPRRRAAPCVAPPPPAATAARSTDRAPSRSSPPPPSAARSYGTATATPARLSRIPRPSSRMRQTSARSCGGSSTTTRPVPPSLRPPRARP